MAEVVWSPRSLADLGAIADYIGLDSEHYARLFVERVVAAVEMLAVFPEAGRVVPEYERHDLRELLFLNYRIVYRIKGNEVQIAAVVHGARLLPDVEDED